MNTKKLLFVALMMMCAITVHALQLREGHFFKTFSDVQPMVKAAPALFDQWFALPEDTEWREVSRQTDNIGMERIEYRQYVGGVEVEYSQVLLHVRDGRVQSANGTVMEQQRTPAKLQRNSVMSRGGTPTDLLGRKLLLIDTDEGYRYATMCISADGRYKVYHDVETGEELKRVPLMHSISAPEGTPATITGKSIYSGDQPLDVTKGTDGMYYLYDQQRNIHTVVGAYLPSYSKLAENGKLFDYFPRHDLTDEDLDNKDMEKLQAWTQQINADYETNNLPQFEQYITDYMRYAPNQGDTWTAYHLKSLTLSDTDFNIDEDSYVSLNLHYSQGTEETTTVGKLWSGKMDKTDAPLDFLKLNKIVIAPTEGATLIISLFKNVKDEETQMQDLEETFLGVVPLTFSPEQQVKLFMADVMNPCVELTVMAHEYTHIITGQTAKLEYKSESGALNESFSDIMGISVKKWIDPSYKQWTCGSGGLMVNYTNLRDMKNPRNSMDGKEESRRCPGYYHGYNWFDTTDTSDENDNGGVHRNCGVQNRWYFLLCEGETSDNSNFVEGGKPYSMTGIGMEKALQIAYRTLTQYATSQSQYADIRLCHLQAAKDLYGDNSSEVQAVAKA